MSETLGHDGGKILVRIGDPAAGAHGIAVGGLCRARLLALGQRAGRAHEQLAEFHDADIGRVDIKELLHLCNSYDARPHDCV